jgi:hypothetical protein
MKRIGMLLLIVLAVAGIAQADNFPTVAQLAAELTANSNLPMGPGAAELLASNMLTAQFAVNSGDCSNYVSCSQETGSLSASITSVLYAINTIMPLDGQTMVVVPQAGDAPQQPFLNSVLPIDTDVSIQFSMNGQVIGPGEGISWGLCLIGQVDVCQYPPTVTAMDLAPPVVMDAPEPSALALLACGMLAIGLQKRRVRA